MLICEQDFAQSFSDIYVAFLAQWLERAAVNRKVAGSIPAGGAFFQNDQNDQNDDQNDRRKISATGNRTRVIRVTGGYTNHYTTAECC